MVEIRIRFSDWVGFEHLGIGFQLQLPSLVVKKESPLSLFHIKNLIQDQGAHAQVEGSQQLAYRVTELEKSRIWYFVTSETLVPGSPDGKGHPGPSS